MRLSDLMQNFNPTIVRLKPYGSRAGYTAKEYFNPTIVRLKQKTGKIESKRESNISILR